MGSDMGAWMRCMVVVMCAFVTEKYGLTSSLFSCACVYSHVNVHDSLSGNDLKNGGGQALANGLKHVDSLQHLKCVLVCESKRARVCVRERT